MYSSDKSHQVYIFDANRGLYSTVNIKLTKEELEKGISIQGITDDTDYLRAVEKSIGIKTEDILLDDIKKLYAVNEKEIKLIEKKYEKMINKLISTLPNQELTEEQKKRIYSIMGYDDEIRPYIETRDMLRDKLYSHDRKSSLVKKPQ